MNRAVLFTAAELDFIEALDWYEVRALELGLAFRAEMDHQIGRITDNPLQFPVMLADVRRARLRRFPYSLFFRTEADAIFVVGFFHASQNPRHWEERS